MYRSYKIAQISGTLVHQTRQHPFDVARKTIFHWFRKNGLGRDGILASIEEIDAPHKRYDNNMGHIGEMATAHTNGATIWGMSYFNPQKKFDWHAEATVVRDSKGTTFLGTTLTAVFKGAGQDPNIVNSIPSFVREIAKKTGLKSDGQTINDGAKPIVNQTLEKCDEVDDLAGFLYDPRRKKPIVLVSADRDGTQLPKANTLVKGLVGIAHVFSIDQGSSQIFVNLAGKELSLCFNGIGIYAPLENNKLPFEIVIPETPENGREIVVNKAFEIARPHFTTSLLTFEEIRQLALK